jgi:hypothetical protein
MTHIRTLAAATAVAGLTALAMAATGSGEPRKAAKEIRVLAEITTEQSVDNPPAGASAGDLHVFTQRLTRSGRRVGALGGTCVLLTPPAGFQCRAIAELPNGGLTVAANLGEGPATGAITGGTGRYRRARGSVRIEPLGEGRERIVFRPVD